MRPEPKEKVLEGSSPIDPIENEAEAPYVAEAKVVETHHENESDLKDQETSPQNLEK